MLPEEVLGRWTPSSAEGRWCGFGPYYAMFPVEFVRKTVEKFCPPGGGVLDPFCGRGTTPFVASVSGREAVGSDLNKVAWLYSTVKLDPARCPNYVLRRVEDVLDSIEPDDRKPENAFQELAWHTETLGFLHSARRILDWRSNRVDRTLMGTILVHLHAKLGEGLSNQLRQSKSMAPDYAVRWWLQRGLTPPKIDLREFFRRKIAWRYSKGIPPKKANGIALLGDARLTLPKVENFKADLVLTSPPYCGVTNYEYDNWIRLWMLGGPSLPSMRTASRFVSKDKYVALLREVFTETKRLCQDNAVIYVRTDAREFTRRTTVSVLTEVWPDHCLSYKSDIAPGPTQTALFGHTWDKVGETDLLLIPKGSQLPRDFFDHEVAS